MLTHYRYFVAIADCGGTTAAARELGISQPALSRSLKALEFALATKLIDRESWEPTAAGTALIRRARLLLAEQKSMLDEIKGHDHATREILSFNGSPMTAMALIPRIVEHIARTHPALRLSVRGDNGANYQWKVDALLAGHLDLAITIADPLLSEAGLLQVPLFDPDLRVVLRRSEKESRRAVDLEDLLDRRWILPPPGSSTRAVIENEFRIRNIPIPRDTIEISDWRIVLDVLESTDWVTAMPYHPACFENKWDRYQVLPIQFQVRPLAVVMAARPLSTSRPQMKILMSACQHVVQEAVRAKGSAIKKARREP